MLPAVSPLRGNPTCNYLAQFSKCRDNGAFYCRATKFFAAKWNSPVVEARMAGLGQFQFRRFGSQMPCKR